MDKTPRPTPRRSRDTNRGSDGDVDYRLIEQVGADDIPNPSPNDSDDNDPDACPACGHFHYGKQHESNNIETGAVYLRPLNKPCAKCDRTDCADIGHFIKAGYIKDGTFDSSKIKFTDDDYIEPNPYRTDNSTI